MKAIIHTDGACSGNPGPGGWCFLVQTQKGDYTRSGHRDKATNNTMELRATLAGLYWCQKHGVTSVQLWSDSNYIVSGVNLWLPRWVIQNWRTKDHKVVANQRYWRAILAITSLLDVKAFWVKAHAANTFNEYVNREAQARCYR